MNIAETRLFSQRLIGQAFTTPTEVVRWCGAVQAQDYPGAKWALALRCGDVANDDVDAAFDAGLTTTSTSSPTRITGTRSTRPPFFRFGPATTALWTPTS